VDDRINATHIALILKKNSPINVLDFRPISLCNVLTDITSLNQSSFIPRRLITDNVLATYETMHTMQTRMWSKVGFMGIKLDMSKAYDRV
jgi:hypothetical protein